MQDKSLDHLIYDGMGQFIPDHRKGTHKIIGSVRLTKDVKMKFAINLVFYKGHYPYVDRSVGRNTMDEAIEFAIQLAKSQLSNSDSDRVDTDDQIREELTIDGFYIPTRNSSWSICINEVMDGMD